MKVSCSPSRWVAPFLVAMLCLLGWAKADFGDTVDPTFNCPALTTCAQVCVATVEDCPAELACPGEQLCADGSCAEECDPDLETVCAFECAPVACHRLDETPYDVCTEQYGPLYDAEAACGEVESAYELTLLQFNEPAYIFAYTWVSGITFLILVWCAFNNKIAPIEGSTKKLQLDATTVVDKEGEGQVFCTQTGYKDHPIGFVLYVLTMLTFGAWTGLLLFMTIQYYVYNEQPQLSNRKLRFEDENQLLKTFIIVWNVGFAWCFALKWPLSIRSLFLRRCRLSSATHVAVFLENGQESNQETALDNNSFVGQAKHVFEIIFGYVNTFMAFVFSDTEHKQHSQGVFQYCKVKRDQDGTRSFVFMLRRYNLQEEGVFFPGTWSVGATLGDFLAAGQSKVGLTKEDVMDRYRVVGQNTIEMERPSFLKSVAEEFKKPFYTYQLFLVWTWFPLYYWYMAMLIGSTITLSAVTVAFFHYRNLRNLYKITHISGQAQVLRDGDWVSVDQKNLVPGDLVKLAPGETYCDMVMVSGGDTLLDESALTGEATPQVKKPIDTTDSKYKYLPDVHKRHTIAAGTTILEEGAEAMAVVTKTASYTVKGELLREIFRFRRHSFKFDKEVFIVMAILVLYAIFGFSIVLHFVDDNAVVGWFYGMYVVATVIPPLLPTTFTVSVGVSDFRLSLKKITCAQSESILIAGKVNQAFFDKTGTLTKQGLDFKSARSADDWKSQSTSKDLTMAMACCHSLVRSSEGVLIGNPVDRTMFSASGASLDSVDSDTVVTDGNGNKIQIVRQFDFDHTRMTQSVIAKLPDGKFVAFVKGSGENVSNICKTETLPEDFHSYMAECASTGIYQISVASKPVDSEFVSAATRDDVEKDCNFVGVLNFLNALREESPGVIRQLAEGSVQSTMITGDNTMTGIRVAKEAGILSPDKNLVIGNVLDGTEGVLWTKESGAEVNAPTLEVLQSQDVELALSGKAWLDILETDPKLAKQIAPFVRVFGRCTPHDKVSVVDTFVELGFITLMCGDGGNDCGALKAAHVGIALSDAEASVVAPFTSVDRKITSVVDVLLEGRCALASALAVYKYIIMYGQITTMNQIMNSYFQITFAEWNWMFIDGVFPITMAYSLPLARAAKTLAKTRPTASILGAQTISSVVGMFLFHLAFTTIALAVLFQQDWFQCRKWVPTDLLNALIIGDNYEAQVIWLVTGAQYISTAMALNFGYEFRRGWLRNYVFVLLSVGLSTIMIYTIFVPGKLSCFFRVNCSNEDVVRGVTGKGAKTPIQNFFNTTLMPDDFQWTIFAIIVANTIAVCIFEKFVVNGIRQRRAAAKQEALENGGKHMLLLHGSNVGARRASVDSYSAHANRSSAFFPDTAAKQMTFMSIESGAETQGSDDGANAVVEA